MLGLLRHRSSETELASSMLYNERTFYPAFIHDLRHCKSTVLIESPFITSRRVNRILPVFEELRKRGVKITINTRGLEEQEDSIRPQARLAIARFQALGIQVLCTTGHHRKLAIMDGKILWEGSLNILSQNYSCEIMRRIVSKEHATQMLNFIGIVEFLS